MAASIFLTFCGCDNQLVGSTVGYLTAITVRFEGDIY